MRIGPTFLRILLVTLAGCTDVPRGEPCPSGMIVDRFYGACVPLTNYWDAVECKPGTFACAGGDQLRKCNSQSRRLEVVEQCASTICDAVQGKCLSACTPGTALGCYDSEVRSMCGATGKETTISPCRSPTPLCDRGTCVGR